MVLFRHKWVLPTKRKPNNTSVTILFAWQPIIIFNFHLSVCFFLFLLKLHMIVPKFMFGPKWSEPMRKTELHLLSCRVHFVAVLSLFLRGHILFGKQLWMFLHFYWEFCILWKWAKMPKTVNAESTESVCCFVWFFVNNNSSRDRKLAQHRDSHFTQEPLYHDFVLFVSTLQSEAF